MTQSSTQESPVLDLRKVQREVEELLTGPLSELIRKHNLLTIIPSSVPQSLLEPGSATRVLQRQLREHAANQDLAGTQKQMKDELSQHIAVEVESLVGKTDPSIIEVLISQVNDLELRTTLERLLHGNLHTSRLHDTLNQLGLNQTVSVNPAPLANDHKMFPTARAVENNRSGNGEQQIPIPKEATIAREDISVSITENPELAMPEQDGSAVVKEIIGGTDKNPNSVAETISASTISEKAAEPESLDVNNAQVQSQTVESGVSEEASALPANEQANIVAEEPKKPESRAELFADSLKAAGDMVTGSEDLDSKD